MPEGQEYNKFVTFLFMGLNIFCVVSIVIFNKMLYMDYGYTFANTVVCWHFFCTGLMLWISADIFGLFEKKKAPLLEIFFLSLTQVGSVATVNLSLLYNTVGTYQILKLLNIPVICLMEYFWIRKIYSPIVLASLAVILAGVGIVSVTDVRFSPWGFFHGVMATVTTGAYQILANTKQKQYGINAMQMLYYQAPMTTVMLGIGAILFDDRAALVAFEYNRPVIALLVITGVIAFGVNLTVFLILGRASPVTYQVVGHFKTVLVLIFGFVALHDPVVAKNIVGMGVAMGGIVWYSYLGLKPAGPPIDTRGKDKEREREALMDRAEKAVGAIADSPDAQHEARDDQPREGMRGRRGEVLDERA